MDNNDGDVHDKQPLQNPGPLLEIEFKVHSKEGKHQNQCIDRRVDRQGFCKLTSEDMDYRALQATARALEPQFLPFAGQHVFL